ncbi:IncP-type conjugal transfer protein TraG [Hyphomicrobium sp. CS1BSMeth3]|uniref:IncP-type conjugal transfer protein TraG n=1 Tax=Hyphomicrobium sp. CS1BSMeth3 TaxID=1892844 RepID=UPI0009303700|nr:IncP-type conjugal transfer protein TraG [Hyphomicrobium sp. CS1BSMeth3]
MTFTVRHSVGYGAATAISVVFSVWLATQWAAAMLGFHPALGSAWLSLLNWPVYAPWQLFPWWLTYGHIAPRVFDTAGLIAVAGALIGGGFSIGGAAWRASRRKVVTTYGSARWADIADMRAAHLIADRGVMLGQIDEEYLRDDGPHHVLAVAPTRSGKGVGLVVPTLLSWPESAVIHDIKGENWQLTSGWRARGSDCFKFDPTAQDSARFNPLLEVRKGPNEVRDVQNIADILVDPDGSREVRDHWQKTAHALLVGTILHVLYAEEEKTLARVARLLSDPSRSIDRTLWAMMTTNHVGSEEAPQVHPQVAEYAREVLNKVPNERSGVVSTAVSLLSLYRDPLIAKNTSSSDWAISDLMDGSRAISLYLVVPPSDLSRTRPLMRLMLNLIARRLTEELKDNSNVSRRRLLLMLDEFPALGRLDFFEGSLAFLAGYGVRAYLIAQSLNQIEKAYGNNNAIVDNCHVRIAFAANDERTAKRLSDALGTKTEIRAQRNLAGKRLSPWLGHTSISEQETARPLLTPGEVMQLPVDEALIFASGCPPIRAKKLRYFDDRNLVARCLPAAKASTPIHYKRPSDVWGTRTWGSDERLVKQWGDLVTVEPSNDGHATEVPQAQPSMQAAAAPRERDTDLIIDEPRRRRTRRAAPTAQLSFPNEGWSS